MAASQSTYVVEMLLLSPTMITPSLIGIFADREVDCTAATTPRRRYSIRLWFLVEPSLEHMCGKVCRRKALMVVLRILLRSLGTWVQRRVVVSRMKHTRRGWGLLYDNVLRSLRQGVLCSCVSRFGYEGLVLATSYHSSRFRKFSSVEGLPRRSRVGTSKRT